MKKINIHAGHNPKGMIGAGAVGLIDESTENRKVVKYVKKYLKRFGITVYDNTCNNGTSQSDVLKKIVKKSNAHKVDLDVSIHFNSGVNDKKGDGKTTGVEVLLYDKTDKKLNKIASSVCKSVEKLGYKNRGVKVRPDLYVLNETKAPAMLIECCFVDDYDDVKLYNARKMAEAIVEGILNCFTFHFKAKKGAYQQNKPGPNYKTREKIKKNEKCKINKINIIDGKIWCRRKKANMWIKRKWME